MKTSKYLTCMVKDFFTAFGGLTITAAVFLAVYSVEAIESTMLWQLVLAASAYTLFKYAFVNKCELSKKAQLINITVCTVLGDFMIVLWMFWFSPSKLMDKSLMMMYIAVIFIVKGAVYAMMYIDGHQQAKQVNEKLNEYQKLADTRTFSNS